MRDGAAWFATLVVIVLAGLGFAFGYGHLSRMVDNTRDEAVRANSRLDKLAEDTRVSQSLVALQIEIATMRGEVRAVEAAIKRVEKDRRR